MPLIVKVGIAEDEDAVLASTVSTIVDLRNDRRQLPWASVTCLCVHGYRLTCVIAAKISWKTSSATGLLKSTPETSAAKVGAS